MNPRQVRDLTGRVRDYARQYAQLRVERERELLGKSQHNGTDSMARAAWADLDDALNELEAAAIEAPGTITLVPERYGGKRP